MMEESVEMWGGRGRKEYVIIIVIIVFIIEKNMIFIGGEPSV